MNELFESLRDGMEEKRVKEDDFVAFQDWEDEDIRSILNLGIRESLSAGQEVIQMGAAEDRDLYIIVSGQLEAYHFVAEEEKRLALMGSGDMFGEISFVDGKPRSANVRVRKDTVLLKVSPEGLEAFCSREPVAALKFMREIARVLSSRLRKAES